MSTVLCNPLHEAGVTVGKVEGKEVDLARHTADHRHRLAEVRLGVARGVMQGHEHLARPKPPLTDIVLHDADRVKTRAVTGMEVWVTMICGDPT